MAQLELDPSGNEPFSQFVYKLKTMLTELYTASAAAAGELVDWVGTSVTASGLVQGGTVTSTGLATAGSLKLDTGTKTATAVAGAATLNKDAGVITSEALTTAAGDEYTLTLTNSSIAAADQVFASVFNGSNNIGPIYITTVTPGSSSVVIKVRNGHATEPLTGEIKISFMVLKN